MTHKQWFNNVLHLHPVHEEGTRLLRTLNPKQDQNTIPQKQIKQYSVFWHL